jgi:molybdopterin-guanine dinucleotide biosynthesis protein MobB
MGLGDSVSWWNRYIRTHINSLNNDIHMADTFIPVVIFIGKSGSGKTTLIEKLLRNMSKRGYRLATIKHHSHSGFDIDIAGKDSWWFAQAGSQQVIVAAPDKFATYWKLANELSLDEVLTYITDVDLILVEGYRSSNKPSIEVIRAETGFELVGKIDRCIAIVSDAQVDIGIPCFNLNDIEGIAELIEDRLLMGDNNIDNYSLR